MVALISAITLFLAPPIILDRPIDSTQNMISTNGYYYATFEREKVNNTAPDLTKVVVFFIKFDPDGFCNVYRVPVAKEETIEGTIASKLKYIGIDEDRWHLGKNRGKKTNSGTYTVDNNKINIRYYWFSSRHHWNPFGGYNILKCNGIIIDDSHIKLDTKYGGQLDLKFVEDNEVRATNYLRKRGKRK